MQLTGRVAELGALDRFLDDPGTLPAGLSVEGDPGIGKTALWRYAVGAARARGFLVLMAAPSEAEARLTFAGLGDLLVDVIEEVLPLLPAPQRRALEVAMLLRDPGEEPMEPRAPAVAFLTTIRRLCERAPVVIAVDDVQWLDPATSDVLSFATRRLDGAPMRLLLARRITADPDLRPRVEDVLAEDRRVQLRLGPLSLGALHHVIHDRMQVSLPRPMMLRVHETSAGNPLFGLELTRALEASSQPLSLSGQLPFPSTLHQLLGYRIADLPAPVREALLVIALAAEKSVAVAEGVIGPAAGDHLRAAATAGVIEMEDGRAAFTHPLFAAAVSSTASIEARRRVHRHLAQIVRSPEERARHAALASDRPDEDVAATLELAAGAALGRGAPDTAADLADLARDTTPPGLVEDRRRRAILAAQLHLHADDTAVARRMLEQLMNTGPPDADRATILHSLAVARGRDEGFAQAGILAEAASITPDPQQRAQIEGDLALYLGQSGDVAGAAEHARIAVDLLDASTEPAVAASALGELAAAEFLLGNGLRRDLFDRALPLIASADRRPALVSPRSIPIGLTFAVLLKWSDDFDGARAMLRQLREEGIARHADGWLSPVMCQLSELEVWCANWDEALALAAEAEQAAQRAGSGRVLTAMPNLLRAMVDGYQGRTESARVVATVELERARRNGNHRNMVRCLTLLGGLDLAGGDHRSARPHLERAAELVHASGCRDPGVFRCLPDNIEALIGVGMLAGADIELAALERSADRLDRPSARAAAGRCRGLLEAARGNHDEAVAALEQALIQHRRLTTPVEEARTRLALGEVQRRAKHRSEARESLQAAIDAFELLSAPVWAARATAELARLGGRTRATGLTPTERRIAEQVADGRTNKEIAAAVFVTPKTVETQLSRIYAKLQIRSRADLVRYVLNGGGDRVDR